MTKDSDKLSLLAKRKRELDHALAHDLPRDAIETRAEKLRLAVLAVIKKLDNRLGPRPRAARHGLYQQLAERWNALSVDAIIRITRTWRARPSTREIRQAID